MKSINLNFFLILLFVITSCNKSSQPTEGADHNANQKSLDTLTEVKEDIKQEQLDCGTHSAAMKSFISLLVNDNYDVGVQKGPASLIFETEKKDVDPIEIPDVNFSAVHAKRTNSIKDKKGWYPSFSIFEICYPDEQTAAANQKKIEAIISRSDLKNEKNYDYIVQNANRLIYVSCGAKLYEEYAFAYKEKLEGIINK